VSHIYIIAEAGVNHNGNPDLAFKLVDAAVEANADAVKFQTFKAENLVTKSALKAKYQQQTTDVTESQFTMLKNLELARETHFELLDYCNKKGIEFLSTAFDADSLDFVINELGAKKLKLPSGEITNGPSILMHAQSGSDIIVSTGMSTIDEIEDALAIIAYGLLYRENSSTTPSRDIFFEAYHSPDGQDALTEKVTLLHCTSEYPAQPIDINLNAMCTLRDTFKIRVGYSDHSKGITVPIAAAAMGATLIEKHFTLDKSLPGPDHKASLNPEELIQMVKAIRVVEKVMGDGKKEPMSSEIDNRGVIRKSLVAACDITKGDFFTKDNIAIKRPGTGKNPMGYWDLLGSKSLQDYKQDEIIV